jgi:hypothetical protein
MVLAGILFRARSDHALKLKTPDILILTLKTCLARVRLPFGGRRAFSSRLIDNITFICTYCSKLYPLSLVFLEAHMYMKMATCSITDTAHI